MNATSNGRAALPRRLRENSQCHKIYETLKAAKGGWVEMPALVELSGSYNIHSRVDELRHVHNLPIENETDLTVRPHISRYRLPRGVAAITPPGAVTSPSPQRGEGRGEVAVEPDALLTYP